MKNEKEFWLEQAELKQLLEGGLFWKDIETKLSPADNEGFKRKVSKEDVNINPIVWEPYVNKSHPDTLQEEPQTESDQIRAILLGEENLNYLQEDYLQEEKELASVPHAAVGEDSEVKKEEKDAFSTSDEEDALKVREEKHFDDDDDFMMELENKGTPFGGLKLIVLLIVTAILTFGFWYYFLSS